MQYLIAIVLVALAIPFSPPAQPALSETLPYKIVSAEVTAYSSDSAQTDSTPFTTASGTHVHQGTIACPPDMPFGTQVEIASTTYTCEDRMSTKFPKRFDIWMESTPRAIAWGMKTMDVKILLSTQNPL